MSTKINQETKIKVTYYALSSRNNKGGETAKKNKKWKYNI